MVEEAQKFLNPGTFNCDLGDTVLLSLANALCIQFIVFTTMEYHPVIHVTPRCIKSGCTIYLAYTHTGCGHYDSVIDNVTSDEQSVVSQRPKAALVARILPEVEEVIVCLSCRNTPRPFDVPV